MSAGGTEAPFFVTRRWPILVLGRKLDEVICIGDDVEVMVVGVIGNLVRLGVRAPKETHIWRKELPPKAVQQAEPKAEFADVISKRVLMHLCRGSIELARAALEDGWSSHVREHEPLPFGRDLLTEPLARVLDELRLLQTLEKNGIDTIGDLLRTTERDWAAIPNLGEKAITKLREIRTAMKLRAEAAA